MRILVAAIMAMLLFATGATAQSWQASIRPDAKNGGERIVVVAELGNGNALFFQCDGQRRPSMAFISNNMNTFPSMPSDTGVSLAFDIDGFKSEGVATYYDHGSGYLGLKIEDRALVSSTIANLAGAKFGIKLTISNPRFAARQQHPAGLGGANDAARQFEDYCFRGNSLPQQQTAEPAPQTAVRASPWRVYQAARGGALVLSADTDPKEGTLQFACTDGQLTLLYLSSKPRELPFDRTARSVALTVEIDGFTHAGEAGYYEDERGAGIAFGQQRAITDMVSLIAIAQDEITMTLLGIQGAPYVRTFGIPGAAESARIFLDNCR